MSPGDSTVIRGDEGRIRASGVLARRGLLLVVSANFLGRSFLIDRAVVVLGRDSSCDAVLEDPLVSKRHCTVNIDAEGRFHLEDLGSRNATFLNGKKLSGRRQLFYGDRIIVGETVLRFFLEERIDRR